MMNGTDLTSPQASTSLSIAVIGLGIAERAELNGEALEAFCAAQWIVGSARQLAVVRHLLQGQQCKVLPPLAELAEWLDALQQQGTGVLCTVAVLASGDPLFYGIGRWFSQRFAARQLTFFPAVSSIQGACHALGIALQDVEVVSLHGRPGASLRRHLNRGRTLAVLTDADNSPAWIARQVVDAGLRQTQCWVCEALGHARQRVREFPLAELAASREPVDPLNVVVLRLQGEGGLPEFPGVADTLFDTGADGSRMITKREVRLAILSLLQPGAGEQIWDIGAGCGSVAVELAYWRADISVVAVEQHPGRVSSIRENRDRFGVVANLRIVQGRAPSVLTGLPSPDKVFIGGSDGEMDPLLRNCWQRLPTRGILVASAVTEGARQQLFNFAIALDQQGSARFDAVQIAVSRANPLGTQWVFRPQLPVTLFQLIKLPQSETPEAS